MTTPEIDETALRSALADQHPDLANLPLREVDGGWGNQMWRLGADLAVRVQRMNSTADRQLKERRWLPVLAPRLPLPIPQPIRDGVATPGLPKIWTVMTWVHGDPLDRSELTRPEAGEALADFLTALHVPAPADAPTDTQGRSAHPKDCGEELEHFSSALDPAALEPFRDRMDAVWHEAVTAPEWEGPPVWVHGDLHPANVVASGGTLAGVVDFEDVHASDPATDVAAAWLLLPQAARLRFFAAYPHRDEATIRRARGHAILRSLFLMLMGQNGSRGIPGGKPGWDDLGRASLQAVLA